MTAIYIFATVFGVGIMAVDFFMMMSSGGQEAGDDLEADTGAEDEGSSGEQEAEAVDHEGSVMAHRRQSRGNFALKTLGLFRSFVYFCVGFGPAGWLAESVFKERWPLLWAVAVGLIVMVVARLFRRIQTDQLDSSISDSELLLEKAIVLVSFGPGKMGKVRIAHGGMNIDRYAVSKSPIDAFLAGDEVRVCEVKDEYVIVEPTI